ncbi:MAG: bifunctional tetrahydrofolate synthase/dihydrofolate synthase [Halothiobacillaceae bacterium]|nr:MAG: bifunctional tetrahydrofolate synthase/dihydrofolate synthase [Halothiobacillaceae bacterium]
MFHSDSLGGWLSHLEAQHPRGQSGIELGLERVAHVLKAMGLSSRLPFPVITVAGTNGKGSSVAMLESVLTAAGHRVGTYTSPHLLRYNERVHLDASPVEDETLIRAFERVEAARGATPLTYFEFGTLAALVVFVEAGVDAAILEVGLGGRLDAVNAVDADAALITHVALDHVEWLGEDREMIGFEKAGVFRPGQVAVIAEAEPPRSVLEHARTLGLAPFRRGEWFQVGQAGDHWTWSSPDHTLTLPLPALAGAHQLDNAAGVIMLLEGLRSRLAWNEGHLREGLRAVRHPGRLQCIRQDGVPVWIDVAHNPAGVEALSHAMAAMPHEGRTLAVFAALADKDALGMARQLAGQVDRWYVAGLEGPRGRTGEALAEKLQSGGLPVAGSWAHPRLAYNAALANARAQDRLLVFGSFLCVADILEHVQSLSAQTSGSA